MSSYLTNMLATGERGIDITFRYPYQPKIDGHPQRVFISVTFYTSAGDAQWRL